MGPLPEDQVKQLPQRFETVPYSTFFKLWYALQKALPKDEKAATLTKIGRTIGKEFDASKVETIQDLVAGIKNFFEAEWPVTDIARVGAIKDDEGNVTAITVAQDSCRMCFANTYYKEQDSGTPTCIVPQLMLGLLSKVKSKFHFKNLRYDGIEKGGIGECTMVWRVA